MASLGYAGDLAGGGFADPGLSLGFQVSNFPLPVEGEIEGAPQPHSDEELIVRECPSFRQLLGGQQVGEQHQTRHEHVRLGEPQDRLCLLFSLSSLKETVFTRLSSRDPLASKKQTPICWEE